jgi:hypothetical protein
MCVTANILLSPSRDAVPIPSSVAAGASRNQRTLDCLRKTGCPSCQNIVATQQARGLDPRAGG